jgi:hypothetical protein
VHLAESGLVPADLVDERGVPGAELVGQTADSPNVAEVLERAEAFEVFGRDPEVFLEVRFVRCDVGDQDLDQQLVAVVCELDFSVRVDEHVGGFNVAG